MAKGFELFMNEEPELAKAYGGMVMQVAKSSATRRRRSWPTWPYSPHSA